jgi:hypothetical protein
MNQPNGETEDKLFLAGARSGRDDALRSLTGESLSPKYLIEMLRQPRQPAGCDALGVRPE